MNTRDTFENERPTLVVDVPHIPRRRDPQPTDGYGFYVRAAPETHLYDIPNEEWVTIVLDTPPADSPYSYQGHHIIDDITCHVWWIGETEGFIAQSINAC